MNMLRHLLLQSHNYIQAVLVILIFCTKQKNKYLLWCTALTPRPLCCLSDKHSGYNSTVQTEVLSRYVKHGRRRRKETSAGDGEKLKCLVFFLLYILLWAFVVVKVCKIIIY